MQRNITIVTIISLFYYSQLIAQEPSLIYLDSIKGIVYEIRNDMHGYVDNIHQFPVNDIIYPAKIHYPETKMMYGFDGVFPNDSFAIIFTGNIITKDEGLYELSVTSDDGSRLWVDGEEVIENDGSHPMRKRSAKVFLKETSTPFRLWYYQDNLDRMGLIFEQHPAEPDPEPEEIISFDSDLLFDSGKYELQQDAFPVLDDFIDRITSKENIHLVIEGHTDSTGSAEFNQILSLKRAKIVTTYLKRNMGGKPIKIEAKGYGFSKPRIEETTEADRKINRRVEILIFQN